MLMAISAWVLVPTGTPDDVVTFFIMNKLGSTLYAIMLIVLLLLMWHYKIHLGTIKQAMHQVWNKIKRSLK
jgi:hypothetical protein